MAIPLSLVLVLGIAVWLLHHKYAGLKPWHGVICVLFGFYLATSTLAPEIRTTVNAIINALTGHGGDRGGDHHDPNQGTTRTLIFGDGHPARQRHLGPGQARPSPGHDPTVVRRGRRLRTRLARTLADLHDLIAAARATLGAHADGEPDALYYLRDELDAQGQLPAEHRERP